jgi:hypothetical protein
LSHPARGSGMRYWVRIGSLKDSLFFTNFEGAKDDQKFMIVKLTFLSKIDR